MTANEMEKLAQFMVDKFGCPVNYRLITQKMTFPCMMDFDLCYDDMGYCWKQVFKSIGITESDK